MAKKSKKQEPVSEDFEDDLDGEEYDDEEFDDEEFEEEDEDGLQVVAQQTAQDEYWWTPHLVLGLLLLIGLLGFFGLFNNVLGFLAAKPSGHHEAPAVTATTVATAAPEAPPRPTAPAQPTVKRPPAPVYGAKHLLVQYKGSMRAGAAVSRSKEEAQKRAAEAAKKAAELKKANAELKDLSTKFSELVGEYSDEPGAKERGGDLGRFRKGSMVPQFQAAVEKMKVGDVSEVVETPFGFHVILRTL